MAKVVELIRKVQDDGTVSFHAGFKPKTKVLVRIEAVPRIRTLRQNRHYFGTLVRKISEHTGHSVEEVHESLKRGFNPIEVPNFKTGEMMITGGSTREMTVGEFAEFTEKAIDLCKYLGIKILPPDQYYQMLEQ